MNDEYCTLTEESINTVSDLVALIQLIVIQSSQRYIRWLFWYFASVHRLTVPQVISPNVLPEAFVH